MLTSGDNAFTCANNYKNNSKQIWAYWTEFYLHKSLVSDIFRLKDHPITRYWNHRGSVKLLLYPHWTLSLVGVGGPCHATPQPFYLWNRATIPIVEEVIWAPRPVFMGMVKRKSLSPPGFEHQTIQHVMNH